MTDILKLAIAVIVGILLIGLFLALLKLAIIVAIGVGIVALAQHYFGQKRLK